MYWSRLIFLCGTTLLNGVCLADDFCSNQENIAYLINRPANATSPCAVAYKDFLVEGGAQHRIFSENQSIDVYPNTELRFGLPEKSEIYLYTPAYIASHANSYPNGNTTIAIGGKHQIWGKDNIVFTLDGFIVVPGGSRDYGMQTTGEHVNAIVEYIFHNSLSFTFMFSYLHLGQPASEPNLTYSAVSPNIVLSYNFTPLMTVYAEVYGQSKTSPLLGSGYNADGGLIFLITNNITLDVEVATRISGQLGQFDNYIGAGGVIRL